MIPRIETIAPDRPATSQAQQRRRIRRRLFKAYGSIIIYRKGEYSFRNYPKDRNEAIATLRQLTQ